MEEIQKTIWGTTKYVKGNIDLVICKTNTDNFIEMSLLEEHFSGTTDHAFIFSKINREKFFDLVDLFIEAKKDLEK